MIRFKTLTIKNFLSFGATPTVVNLDRGGTTLILGENLDDTTSGTGANGVGKTTIMNALVYALYDKPISNISKDNLVNNINKKHMEVVVEFEIKDTRYRIHRVRKAKTYAAGNYVHLFENDIDITPDSAANTNKAIEEILGLPYELFVRIVVFSATHVPFLDLPIRSTTGPNQTDIIEELFDLKTLSEKANALVERRKDLEQRLEIEQTKLKALESELIRHRTQIKSAKERVVEWENNTTLRIKTIKQEIKALRGVNISEQLMLHERYNEVESQITSFNQKLVDLKKDLKRYVKSKTDAEKEIEHLQDNKCPYCLQDFHDAQQKIQQATDTISKYDKKSEDVVEEIEGIQTILEEKQQLCREISSKIDTTFTLKALRDAEKQIERLEHELQQLENSDNPYVEILDELEAVQLEQIEYESINLLTKQIDHMKFLYKLLTKKDSFVRKTLLNKNLPFLNQRLSQYLSNLGLTHQVEFTHQMTAEISQFGREMEFGNLSNGQRARLNIALSFAFRDVLQSLHQRINICMLDEVLDIGLDSIGVTAAARMLKRKARDENINLYIISHRDEIDSAFDRTLTVQMKDSFSQIKEEDNG